MLTFCIITKNESHNLKVCLESLCKLQYEIIVVDTGSTDMTKSVAQKYTAKVYDYTWCDDFSAARNFAISKATNDFVMMVDSDEFLTDFDKNELEELLRKKPNEVGRIHRKNIFEREGNCFYGNELVNRVFSKKHFYYVGKIHEQIVALNNVEYSTYSVPFYFEHNGYNGSIEERTRKAWRNIRLLEKALKEDGEEPYILYQIAKGYYMIKDYNQAVFYFEHALKYDINPKLEYVIDMIEMYGYSLLNSNQNDKALLLENIYEELSLSADYVFLMGIVYMQNAMFERAIEEFLKASNYLESKVSGVNSYLAYYNIGVIYECIGNKEEAIYYYSKCTDYKLAEQGIIRCRIESKL